MKAPQDVFLEGPAWVEMGAVPGIDYCWEVTIDGVVYRLEWGFDCEPQHWTLYVNPETPEELEDWPESAEEGVRMVRNHVSDHRAGIVE